MDFPFNFSNVKYAGLFPRATGQSYVCMKLATAVGYFTVRQLIL